MKTLVVLITILPTIAFGQIKSAFYTNCKTYKTVPSKKIEYTIHYNTSVVVKGGEVKLIGEGGTRHVFKLPKSINPSREIFNHREGGLNYIYNFKNGYLVSVVVMKRKRILETIYTHV